MKLKTLLFLCLIALVISSSAAHAQTFSVIHTFTGGADGNGPWAGVTIRGGTLYGTARAGGNNYFPQGAVYEITHVGSNWTTIPIYLFNFHESDGAYPYARVFSDPTAIFMARLIWAALTTQVSFSI